MNDSIWSQSLESLYRDLAAPQPAPAGVVAAAVSARFGLALLIKTLEITGNRKGFAGDRSRLDAWVETARRESNTLKQAADDDISGEPARKRSEIPMNAAQAAASGLDVCAEAAEVMEGPLGADLAAAAILLSSAVQSILLCVDANAGDAGREERRAMEARAFTQRDAALHQVSMRLR